MATDYQNISADLIWEITCPYNAFLIKRKQAGGVQFSRDFLNLTNKHSRKYEGFVNEKAIGIQPFGSNGLTMTTKIASKANSPLKTLQHTTFGASTSSRKTYRSIVNSTAKKGYRADLRAEAVARASAIRKSQGKKKDTKASKPRGAKARKAAESA
ncbi:hypothetical protein B0A49_00030 [Cryomyces minteri]|uniref:Ribosomal eL28/Mak16 domain-containing protein n=1 Tax=Cryomyces minteri TaxID=331657 RepID=A0A4U0Y081_9PEZI|nr:hypothetical protein B0A49_00030 [Cryomyces minteri]